MTDHPSPSAALLDDLAAALPPGTVATDADTLAANRRDAAGIAPAGDAIAVVFPRTTEEVSAVLRTASRHRVPVVPRGAGSGLTGGANAVDGGIVVCLDRMTAIRELDPANRYAVVEAGVLNADLSDAAAAHGLAFPPDPASWEYATIGGNVATNAGGLCCVKYGVTGDYVLGLEAVLADGSVLRTGRRTMKGVAGYDLASLLVGSEGTLAVVTAATLRLRPPGAPAATVAASFSSVHDAGVAVAGIVAAGVVPSLLELLDATTIAAVEDWQPAGLDRDAAAQLVVQSDAGGQAAVDEVARIAAVCADADASAVREATAAEEGDRLMAGRRLAYPALERLARAVPGGRGEVLLDDVAVPPTRVPELVEAVARVAAHRGVVIGTYGHAGDGNMHPTLVFDAGDPGQLAAARAAFDDLCDEALRLGGTLTGEHGIGLLKRGFLEAEIGSVSARLQRAIKAAFDPEGILNPGKALA